MSRAITLLLALGVFTACDAMDGQSAPTTPRSDVEFIDAMVPHHRMAVDMAEIELAGGDSPEVRMMAQKMKDAQEAEITKMQAIREELTGSGLVPEHLDHQATEDLEKLKAASGSALDRLFLEEMLPHHAGAIVMSHEALPYLERPDLRSMADKIILDQAKEIGMIAMMLEE